MEGVLCMKIMGNTMKGLAAVKAGTADKSTLTNGQQMLGGGLAAASDRLGVDLIGEDKEDPNKAVVDNSITEVNSFEPPKIPTVGDTDGK